MHILKQIRLMKRDCQAIIDELDLFLGPDTPKRLIWEWCNADRRPLGEGPMLEELMQKEDFHD